MRILGTIWRELRTLVLLNFQLDVFLIAPFFFNMAISLSASLPVRILLGVLAFFSILSLPAAFCAMSRVTCYMVLDRNTFLYRDFWTSFTKNYFKALPGGLFFTAALVILLFSGFSSYQIFGPGMMFFAILAVLLSVGIVVLAASFYFFPMLAMVELPVRALLRNSFILVPAAWRRSLLGLLAAFLIALFLSLVTFSTAFFLLGFVFASLFSLFESFALYPAIEEIVVKVEKVKTENEKEKKLESGNVLRWD